MMILKDLIKKSFPDQSGLEGIPPIPIQSIECDSRRVKPGSLFVAIDGAVSDGKKYISDAIAQGAVAVVSDGPNMEAHPVPWIQIADGRAAVAQLASIFYDEPSKQMTVIGITGTNGKTTSSYLVEYFLRQLQISCGVIGTISYRYDGQEVAAVETTPGAIKIQSILADMRDRGCRYVAMEASSHALDQKRVDQIRFSTALFTNLTQDHLDYHKTFEAYFESKAKLFAGLDPQATAVINTDDPWGQKLLTRTQAKVIGYGVGDEAQMRATHLVFTAKGSEYDLQFQGKKIHVSSPLVGLHNIYNVLGALAVVASLGLSWESAAASLGRFPGVPGRLESVDLGQEFGVYIDFAHTPDGLRNVLSATKSSARQKLIVVFGCGGDRDRTKRPLMAKIAAEYSDNVIVTSDNPRSEDPRVITEEICVGFPSSFKNFSVVIDRRKAIRQALLSARSGDVVLLAGKGHERSQIIAGVAHPFSDREEVERVLSGR